MWAFFYLQLWKSFFTVKEFSIDFSQEFSQFFSQLSITLCCVFGLKEISINLTNNVLAENYQYIFLLIYVLQCMHVWIKLSGKLQILLIIYSAYLTCWLNVEEGRKKICETVWGDILQCVKSNNDTINHTDRMDNKLNQTERQMTAVKRMVLGRFQITTVPTHRMTSLRGNA